MSRQNSYAGRSAVYEGARDRRNPYLVDYEEQFRSRRQAASGAVRREGGYRRPAPGGGARNIVSMEERRNGSYGARSFRREEAVDPGRHLDAEEVADRVSRLYNGGETRHAAPKRRNAASDYRRAGYESGTGRRQSAAQAVPVRRSKTVYRGTSDRRVSGRSRAARRKKAAMQRLMVAIWVLCGVTLAAVLFLRKQWRNAAETGAGINSAVSSDAGQASRQFSGGMVQGLPAEVFARHPDWEENFLTPNEYSRPGDPLESVTNIFVHYTANPGTSAAQNRSYFEQQKDTHEISVSSHFIIGYEGEIIQCVPLDEIAYAVMTRNFDSISIECCYLEEDGSFTQETYDSLISLLAWLTDAYQLDTEDILRHYDCGGKKCPLYYTEHEDAWEQLKKDVDKL